MGVATTSALTAATNAMNAAVMANNANRNQKAVLTLTADELSLYIVLVLFVLIAAVTFVWNDTKLSQPGDLGYHMPAIFCAVGWICLVPFYRLLVGLFS